MSWQPVTTLAPNKLAFLLFDHLSKARWIGYVNEDGICEWPDKVRGYSPTGWQEVLVDLTRLKAVDGK